MIYRRHFIRSFVPKLQEEEIIFEGFVSRGLQLAIYLAGDNDTEPH